MLAPLCLVFARHLSTHKCFRSKLMNWTAVLASGDVPKPPPVWVAARRRGRKGSKQGQRKRPRYASPLFDDRGFPHPDDEWDSLLPDVKAGHLIRKRKHAAPKLGDIDPSFGEEFVDGKHGKMLRKDLNISHLPPNHQAQSIAVIKSIGESFARRT